MSVCSTIHLEICTLKHKISQAFVYMSVSYEHHPPYREKHEALALNKFYICAFLRTLNQNLVNMSNT